ncbi:MAG: TonB-dependent receptor plug domain-containing protein [Rikenellaceae bacterium]|nr:TonB-dependent receptor plug domain-containing protein [Rikenellaceae bacterium]
MKQYLLFIIFLILPNLLSAQEFRLDTTWTYAVPTAEVFAGRPLSDIGVQRTKLDTAILHDNISLSLADILTQHSTIFIKSYGRATLSTASFRGTSPSHTQVVWNGMKMNSPMLGMVDFSMIPAYFIDEVSLLHGTSSVTQTGGGLGGAINLSTKPLNQNGIGLQYIQGVGSFHTFDEYLRLTYGDKKWQISTRAVYSSSPNKFKYRNYNKMENMVWDDDRNLISYDYPMEKNKSGQFNDLHLLQEAYYDLHNGSRLGFSAWYVNSVRGVPMLNVDYKDDSEYVNEQTEKTFRGVVSWDMYTKKYKLAVKAGYTYTSLGYEYKRDLGNGSWAEMIDSRSYVNTYYGLFESDFYVGDKWMFTANLSMHQYTVLSRDKNIISQDGHKAIVGYNKGRTELSAYISAKWRPVERLGISLALRDDMYGDKFTPVIPAGFIDFSIDKKGSLTAKASISRNYRYPTLNDLYFLPGGNPGLKTEKGFTYDAGLEYIMPRNEKLSLKAELTGFDSYINDWILWLPTFKGFWSPVNVKKVHAYGIEFKAGGFWNIDSDWKFGFDGNFAWTPSINYGDPINWADKSIGKQLVYIPKYSGAFTGKLYWKTWVLTYKWCYYSERYTTSSNETATRIGRLLPYYMSDVSLEKHFSLKWANLSVKGVVNNIFNEEYESVLSRPMPTANWQFFIDIKPKFRKRITKQRSQNRL